jgi:putative DNA methylase
MLTWGALNIIGASSEKRAEIERAQREVAEAVDREITALGIEHDNHGNRAKAYLYCLETRCPETGWMVPMAPSWVISKTRSVIAKLVPDHASKRFDIQIVTGVSEAEMQAAERGTVRDGNLVYELDGKTHLTPIKTLRGDYRAADGNTANRLRRWEKHDFKPRPADIFQERLYCIQWMTAETLDNYRPETFFAAVTEEDLARERKIELSSRRIWRDGRRQGWFRIWRLSRVTRPTSRFAHEAGCIGTICFLRGTFSACRRLPRITETLVLPSGHSTWQPNWTIRQS